MKLTKKTLALGALIGGSMVGFSGDVNADTVAGTANAEIRTPVVLTEDTQLDFGIIELAGGAGDTINLDTANAASAFGSSTLAGTAASGVWSATGTSLTAVSISFSTGDTLTGLGTAMPIGGFAHNAGGSPALDASGDLSFNVGASLTVNASQTPGTYSGAYSVTVNYN